MKTEDCDGNEIEIPTLNIDNSDGDEYNKVSTPEDFYLLVKAMGWVTVAEFESETGASMIELLGKFWLLMGATHDGFSRVYLKD